MVNRYRLEHLVVNHNSRSNRRLGSSHLQACNHPQRLTAKVAFSRHRKSAYQGRGVSPGSLVGLHQTDQGSRVGLGSRVDHLRQVFRGIRKLVICNRW